MPALLSDYRLVFVAPADGLSGVGNYSEDFIKAVRPQFGEVIEVRTAGPLADGIRDIRRFRRAVVDAVRQAPHGRVLVHAELGACQVGAFWSTAGLRGVAVTATIHDPPHGVWAPAGIRFIAKHRWIFHGIHYPLRPVSAALEAVVYGRRTLFALTETGQRAIERRYPRAHIVSVPHVVGDRPAIRPVTDRPKAVGFFGHVYRGKGFELISQIRDALADDIVIRVAGRGTESLPSMDGVQILGAVDGPAEDAFFESIRAVVVPYGRRHWYDEVYPGSGVVAEALAYCTPVVCTDYGSLAERDEKTGAIVVRTHSTDPAVIATDLAAAIESLVKNPARLTELGEYVEKTRQARSGARTAEAVTAAWSALLANQP